MLTRWRPLIAACAMFVAVPVSTAVHAATTAALTVQAQVLAYNSCTPTIGAINFGVVNVGALPSNGRAGQTQTQVLRVSCDLPAVFYLGVEDQYAANAAASERLAGAPANGRIFGFQSRGGSPDVAAGYVVRVRSTGDGLSQQPFRYRPGGAGLWQSAASPLALTSGDQFAYVYAGEPGSVANGPNMPKSFASYDVEVDLFVERERAKKIHDTMEFTGATTFTIYYP